MSKYHIICAGIVGLVLVACGGGGKSGQATPPPVTTPPPPAPSTAPVITTTALNVGVQGVPYQHVLTATSSLGGVQFKVQGTLPPGITWDGGNGLYGFPTQIGTFNLVITVTDSATPPQTATKTLPLVVIPRQTVRNDTLASATDIPCCGTVGASLSPYATAAGVIRSDQDFYRINANAGDRIAIDAIARGTAVDTDPVIEVLDVNGARMNTCKTPQASTAFTQNCMNDDIVPGIVRNSHLDVQLPATTGVFVVHVLDWGGRARPEMTYDLKIAKLP